MSSLERLMLAVERHINGRDRNRDHPAWVEDIKVMGVRRGVAAVRGALAHGSWR
jgi:S-adenosylmethionine synthetase